MLQILVYFGASIAVVVATLGAVSFTLGAYGITGVRPPLGHVKGVAVVDRSIFVSSATSGCVFKFDDEGRLITLIQMPKRPISLKIENNQLIVYYSGDSIVLETGLDHRRGQFTAVVDHTWWGHPRLTIVKGNSVRSIALQPWYLTIVQTPWPGLIYAPLFIVALGLSSSLRRRSRASQGDAA